MALLFRELEPALLPETLEAIESFGFDRTTPVQNAAIPLFMQNKDVCVEVSLAPAVVLTRAMRRVVSGAGSVAPPPEVPPPRPHRRPSPAAGRPWRS